MPADEWLGSAPLSGYRSRATASVLRDAGGVITLGLRSLDPSTAIPLDQCPAQTPAVRALLGEVQERLRTSPVSTWQPPDAPGDGRALGLRQIRAQALPGGTGQVVLDIVGSSNTERPEDAALLGLAPLGVSVLVTLASPHRPGAPGAARCIRGSASDHATLDGRLWRFTWPAWAPTSLETLGPLNLAVRDWLALTPAERVIEVGAGCGSLTRTLAEAAAVTAIDQERAATLDVAHNCRDLPNVTARVGPASATLRRLLAGRARFDAALIHAMRRPYGDRILARLAALGVRRALYLAPRPSGLSRDVEESGWRVDRVGFLDQLPGTGHLLTVALLKPGVPPRRSDS